ncbi:hypothetical protein [Jiangella gansuensis]|uniref:hypothetical protein n=1 Tax=Jiangella gansuensis TaxID=281473 RepID=UPI0004BBDDFD|nr:hypothetical protein [Jiangella gansuensis]
MAEPRRGRFRVRRRGRDILTAEFARDLRLVQVRVQRSTVLLVAVVFLCSAVAAGVGAMGMRAAG